MPTIKSIGRKDNNFEQLVKYIHQEEKLDGQGFTYVHNMGSVLPEDQEGIIRSFKENDAYRKKRKGGVGMYHEVMSFHPEDRAVLESHPEILEDLSRIYMELRAADSPAIARPHVDQEHVHIHFMIGANELRSYKATRISRDRFTAIRRAMEEYQLKQYPKLQISYVHSRDKFYYQEVEEAKTKSHPEWQIEERGGKLNRKAVKKAVADIFKKSRTKQDLMEWLKESGYEVYEYKGKVRGVLVDGRKYRFSTLLKDNEPALKKLQSWDRGLELG